MGAPRAARRAPAALIVGLAGYAFCPGPAAWTDTMRERAVVEASRMMPTSLRWLLERHRDSLIAGLREAAGDEGSPPHNLSHDGDSPSAAHSLRDAALSAIGAMDHHRPFAEVIRRFGQTAHFVGDLTWPARVADDDPRELIWDADYAGYVESNNATFPLVFNGWSEASLDAPGPPGARLLAFARATGRRTRQYYPSLRMAYDPDSSKPVALRFDVRSVPYGIASLSRSHMVTDTARVWLFIWKQAHGDLQGTPWRRTGPAGNPAGGTP